MTNTQTNETTELQAESWWVNYVLALDILLGNNNAATRLKTINNDFFYFFFDIASINNILKRKRKCMLTVFGFNILKNN